MSGPETWFSLPILKEIFFLTGNRPRTPLVRGDDVEMQGIDLDVEDETNMDDSEGEEEDKDNSDDEERACENAVKLALKKSLLEKKREYDKALKEAEKQSLQHFRDEIYTQAQRDILRLPRPGTVPPVSKPEKYQDDSSDVTKTKTKDKN